jgi:hypothetical protein
VNRKHISERPPGSLEAYRRGRCRCYPCADAWGAYTKRRKASDWKPLINAQPVREHIAHLIANGVPVATIARRAGISTNGLAGIRGVGLPPTTRVRTEIAARILAIRPEPTIIGTAGFINGTGTYRRLQALQAKGFPRRFLARRLGSHYRHLDLDRPKMVRATFADDVRRLYDELWDANPEAFGQRPSAVTLARTRAVAAGWAIPVEWDDDTIDDPRARPHLARRTDHTAERAVTEAELEDVRWILRTVDVDIATEHGREAVADRLGIKADRLEYIVAKKLPKLEHADEHGRVKVGAVA